MLIIEAWTKMIKAIPIPLSKYLKINRCQ